MREVKANGVNRVPEPDCPPVDVFRWRKDVAAAIREIRGWIASLEGSVETKLAEMCEKIDSVYRAVAGTPQEGGLRDRVERLEAAYSSLRKVLWQLVVALFLFLLQAILKRLGVI